MPLTEKVTFQTVLEKGNRLQMPQFYRWQYKMEQNQMLRVKVQILYDWTNTQEFLAKMDKQGRILIPKLPLSILARGQEPNFAGKVFSVILDLA